MGFDSDDEIDEDAVSELASRIVSLHIEEELPEGWEKQLDPNNGIPYYVNTITQSSQWSRPSSPAGNFHEEDDPEVVKVINDERRLFDSLSLMSHDGGAAGGGSGSVQDESLSSHKRMPLDQNDRIESFISTTENETEPEAKETSTVDIALEEKGETKEPEPEPEPDLPLRKGILQKQGGLFGMWSKKFFVLEDEILSYYDSSQAYLSGARASKQMLLTSSTELSYTKMSHCFKIKTDKLEFILMSENKDLMREWIADIRTIITTLYDARIKGLMKKR
jgi:hypothetical protein